MCTRWVCACAHVDASKYMCIRMCMLACTLCTYTCLSSKEVIFLPKRWGRGWIRGGHMSSYEVHDHLISRNEFGSFGSSLGPGKQVPCDPYLPQSL